MVNVRNFAMTAGIIYLIVGLMGLFGIGVQYDVAHTGLAVEAQHGRLLGLFHVNVLHNIVHLAIGIWGITAARAGMMSNAPRTFAKGLAVLYAVLAVMGLIPVLNTTFGLIPLYGHDVWLHALTAGVAGYFGWVHHTAPVRTSRTASV